MSKDGVSRSCGFCEANARERDKEVAAWRAQKSRVERENLLLKEELAQLRASLAVPSGKKCPDCGRLMEEFAPGAWNCQTCRRNWSTVEGAGGDEECPHDGHDRGFCLGCWEDITRALEARAESLSEGDK